MKFLCDRCKTRYSIGDERVRGKILKIRCKNCANVITVREGMSSEPDAGEPGARPRKTTTVPPMNERSEASVAKVPVADAARERTADPVRERAGVDSARERVAAARAAAVTAKEKPGAAKRSGPGGLGSQGSQATGPGGQSSGPGGQAGQGGPVGQAGQSSGQADGPARRPSASAGRAEAARSEPREPVRNQPREPVRHESREPARNEPRAPARSEPRVEPASTLGALGAAFASAMAKPPPVLDEEWYVSIDGEQEGPFSLGEAQQWVGHKAFDAELYCWSEGFDDWLPVDKVSHFRGLRKRPPPPAVPPPLPRLSGVPRSALAAPPVEEEPKPLFAATMASLERGAPASSPSISLPSPVAPAAPAAPAAPVARATPFGPAAGTRANGASTVAAQVEAKADARPLATRAAASPAPARARIGDPFDTSDPDLQTQAEAEAFRDPILAPSTDLRAIDGPTVVAPPSVAPGDDLAAAAASDASEAGEFGDFSDGDDGELAIGEVSRVVKLGDIVHKRGGDRAARRRTPAPGAAGRSTSSEPSMRASFWTGASPGSQPAPEAAAPPADGDPAVTMAPVAKSHRRGLITLLSVAVVLVLGVIGAVVLLVTTGDDVGGGRLGPVRDIDTSRPEDPITHRPLDPAHTPPPNPLAPRTVPHPRVATPSTGSSHEPETPSGNPLRPDEIEEVARRYQESTQRCYMRAQRGVDSITIGDVRKINVLLTIDGDGNVSDVQLEDHATDNLGKCLAGMLRGWKFRPSSGGRFKFALAFAGG